MLTPIPPIKTKPHAVKTINFFNHKNTLHFIPQLIKAPAGTNPAGAFWLFLQLQQEKTTHRLILLFATN